MIKGYDVERIAQDADIAINALQAISYVCKRDGMISEKYLAEKINLAHRCVSFITGYITEEETNELQD